MPCALNQLLWTRENAQEYFYDHIFNKEKQQKCQSELHFCCFKVKSRFSHHEAQFCFVMVSLMGEASDLLVRGVFLVAWKLIQYKIDHENI